MVDFGEQLRQLRIGSGLTQADLAKASELGQSTISALETGRQKPWPSTRRALARAFHMSLEEFDSRIQGDVGYHPAGRGGPAIRAEGRGRSRPGYPRGQSGAVHSLPLTGDSVPPSSSDAGGRGPAPGLPSPEQTARVRAAGGTDADFPFASGKLMQLLDQLGQAEHQLDQYRLFVTAVCTACWTTDATLHLTGSFGPVAADQENWPGSFQGRHVTEFFDVAWGESRPNYRPLVMQQKAVGGESVSYLWESAGCRYMVFVDPIRDRTGLIIGTVGMAVDVTDRKMYSTSGPSG